MNNQLKAFSIVELITIIAVIILLGLVGWIGYTKWSESQPSSQSSEQTQNSTDEIVINNADDLSALIVSIDAINLDENLNSLAELDTQINKF